MSSAAPLAASPPRPGRTGLRAAGRLLASPKALGGTAILALFLGAAVLGPTLAPYDPSAASGPVLQPPSAAHLLGTTQVGQDVLSQVLVGARSSLLVGFVAAAIATALSVAIGISSGYLGGIIGECLSAVTNIALVIPALPLVIVLSGYLPRKGSLEVAIVISATGWAWGARVLRAQTLSLRNRDFVTASRAVGESTVNIIFREILPAQLPIIAAGFLLTVTFAIITQASLAFLGLVDITQWSWGTMLYWSQNFQAFTLGAWWWYVPPGLCIALTGMALALLNFSIDELVDPRLRTPARSTGAIPREVSAQPGTSGGRPRLPGLHVERLRVDYASGGKLLQAVNGVDLDVGRREIVGIAGESGSGKSTLVLAICRLLPGAGRVVGGRILFSEGDGNAVDIMGLGSEKLRLFRWRKIALVPQAALSALNPVLTVKSQLRDVVVDHDGKPAWTERAARWPALFRLVGLDPAVLDRYAHELSGGMRQRVMIALALALEPRVLVLDEPTTALDVVTQRQIVEELMRLRERLGLTIVLITHDLPLLLEIADRVVVMYGGRVMEVADASRLRSHPLHPYSKGLLRSFPSMTDGELTMSGIPGSPPDLAHLPSGCPFRDRCESAMPVCAEAVPALRGTDEGGWVACRLYDEVAVPEGPASVAVQP